MCSMQNWQVYMELNKLWMCSTDSANKYLKNTVRCARTLFGNPKFNSNWHFFWNPNSEISGVTGVWHASDPGVSYSWQGKGEAVSLTGHALLFISRSACCTHRSVVNLFFKWRHQRAHDASVTQKVFKNATFGSVAPGSWRSRGSCDRCRALVHADHVSVRVIGFEECEAIGRRLVTSHVWNGPKIQQQRMFFLSAVEHSDAAADKLLW